MKQVRFENKMEERGQGCGEQGREATRRPFGVISSIGSLGKQSRFSPSDAQNY